MEPFFSMTGGATPTEGPRSRARRTRARKPAAPATPPETQRLGGYDAHSMVGMGAGVNYLLGGLRSGAPGQWSDNRYEQARHFLGVAYTAIRACCDAVASCEIHTTVPTEADQNDPVFEDDAAKRVDRPGRRSVRRAVGTAAPLGAERTPLDESHPLCQLLADPNPQDTTEDLLYEITLQRRLTGTALLWAVPNGLELPQEMYVLPTALAQPIPRSITWPNGAYRIAPLQPYGTFAMLPGASVGGVVIPAEQIVRLAYKNPYFRYDGYSPLTAGAVQMDILEQLDKARWSAMRRGINPSAVLEVDPLKGANIDNAEALRLQQRFDDRFAGSGNYGALAIMPPGTSLKPYSHRPDTMGFETGWMQMAEFVLSLFGVPKGVIGWMDDYSYAGLYAALKAFHLLTIKPDVKQVSAKLTKFIARPYDRRIRIELELPALDDPQLLETQLANDDRAAIRTVNERRALRKLPPIPGPEGDRMVSMGTEKRIEGNDDTTGRGQGDGSTSPDIDLSAANDAGKGALGDRGRRLTKIILNGKH